MTCIITGCRLINGMLEVGGDLHRIADAYVFVAIKDERGEPKWKPKDSEHYSHYTKTIDASFTKDYMSRGALIVFGPPAALNDAARDYLGAQA